MKDKEIIKSGYNPDCDYCNGAIASKCPFHNLSMIKRQLKTEWKDKPDSYIVYVTLGELRKEFQKD